MNPKLNLVYIRAADLLLQRKDQETEQDAIENEIKMKWILLIVDTLDKIADETDTMTIVLSSLSQDFDPEKYHNLSEFDLDRLGKVVTL